MNKLICKILNHKFKKMDTCYLCNRCGEVRTFHQIELGQRLGIAEYYKFPIMISYKEKE